MTSKCKVRREKEFTALLKGTTGKWVVTTCLLAALVTSSTTLASGWDEEIIETHPTWIYTPDSTPRDGNKRGLMVVLPGCYQTHGQIKNGGNLEKAADDYGLVMAVPFVSEDDAWYPFPQSPVYCWDYGAADEHEHLAEIIALTEKLKNDASLNINPNYVYVVGLSSGATLALKLGCKAPDVFAGIGAIAGPSVGSDQMQATVEGSAIPPMNVSNAISTCRSLAGGKASAFASQIASVAYGDMDKNGPEALPFCAFQILPGQNCVASIKWGKDNIEVLRTIYDTGQLGNATSVQGDKGEEQSAMADGKTRLSLLVIHNVGHAWPAGSGQPNNANNGQYISQEGLDYPQYIAKWLVEHNVR